MYFIDNLRILLISLVVLWHVAVTYGASGTWPYQEVQGDDLTSIVFIFLYAANGPYVLGFFFLITGYFASRSYDRKGAWRFIWDWIRRLGIPIILSGGLGPSNIADAVLQVRPYAVDVNSGVERSPGHKSPKLMKALMDNLNGLNENRAS